MSTVISVFVDVNHDKPGDREAGHCGDQLGTALSAAAVPMQLRLTDTQSIERLAYLGNIVVIAQRRGQQVRARIEVWTRPGLISPSGQHAQTFITVPNGTIAAYIRIRSSPARVSAPVINSCLGARRSTGKGCARLLDGARAAALAGQPGATEHGLGLRSVRRFPLSSVLTLKIYNIKTL